MKALAAVLAALVLAAGAHARGDPKYAKDFEAFVKEVDRSYPFFDLEGSLPRPVAAILDAGCVSAGETVARDLVELCDARLFGTTTAGSSTSKREWTFPGGVATVRFSTRSRNGIRGRPIEFHGIEPHVEVEAVPEEVLAGRNTEILRAEEHLLSWRR